MSVSIITPIHGQKEDYEKLISQAAKQLENRLCTNCKIRGKAW